MRVNVYVKSTNIPKLYDCIAIAMGYNLNQVQSYDCKKVEVSSNIVHAVMDWYKSNYADYKVSFGMEWVCFGPKENKELPDNTVEVHDGFITLEDSYGKKETI